MVVNQSPVTLEMFISCKLLPSHTCNSRRLRPGRRSVANRLQSITGQSEMGCKYITAVRSWLWFWGRVYAARLTNGIQGSQARKSVVVWSQVALYYLANYTLLFTHMSIAPDIDVNTSLRSDDLSLMIAHKSKKSRIFQLVNRAVVGPD